MVISQFYNTAKSYAEKIKEERPAIYEQEGFSITLIMAEGDQEIFTGITSVKISEGTLDTIHSEAIAVMSMIAANKAKAKQMITVTFGDLKVVKPCDECLDMLLNADPDNGKCEIAINFTNSETAINLKSQATNISAEFLEKDTEAVSAPDLGAPAEFVSGFEFDADNPFLAESDEAVEEVKTIASEAAKKPVQPDSLQQPPVGGAIYQQQGFVQQQPGVFQQGYMQQPVYQQQGFVQQPGAYPQGFVQQQPGAYPQGFVQQQPVAYPQGFVQQQPGMQGVPSNPYAQGANKSVHISDVIGAPHDEKFEPVPAASKYAENTEGVLKQRLATLFEEDEDDEGVHNATASKDDLESMAKEMKKNAKSNAKLKNKF